MKTFNTTNLTSLRGITNGQVLAGYSQLSSSSSPTHTHRVPAVNVIPESNLKKNGKETHSAYS